MRCEKVAATRCRLQSLLQVALECPEYCDREVWVELNQPLARPSGMAHHPSVTCIKRPPARYNAMCAPLDIASADIGCRSAWTHAAAAHSTKAASTKLRLIVVDRTSGRCPTSPIRRGNEETMDVMPDAGRTGDYVCSDPTVGAAMPRAGRLRQPATPPCRKGRIGARNGALSLSEPSPASNPTVWQR